MQNTTTQWRRATQFLKNMPPTLFERVVCERELKTEQNCNILTSPLLWPSAFLSRSPGLLKRRPGGPALCWLLAFSTTSCVQNLRSPNWLNFLCTELYNSSTAHSISPHNWPSEYALPLSLEWHVWLSSNGNNCHAVHRSLSSGASVCDCTVGF